MTKYSPWVAVDPDLSGSLTREEMERFRQRLAQFDFAGWAAEHGLVWTEAGLTFPEDPCATATAPETTSATSDPIGS